MAITDLSGNPIPGGGITGDMLGFQESAPEETLGLSLYNMLIEPIRTQDRLEGALFVKRMFDGPQQVWVDLQKNIFALKTLRDVTQCPEELLHFLKLQVGWTPDLDGITADLPAATLRRLISVSIPLWIRRGPEDSIINILSVVTGARVRVLNWFDLRCVIGEAGIGEDVRGTDFWMLSTLDHDEMWSNVRIVDDGTLDHALVRSILKLMRPVGERFEVAYVRFMDLFEVDGDVTQWRSPTDTPIVVADRMLTMDDDTAILEQSVADVDGNADWSNYVATWRIRGTSAFGCDFGVMFYVLDDENAYRVTMDTVDNKLFLKRTDAGVTSILYSMPMTSAPAPTRLADDVWYVIRVEATPEPSGKAFSASA